MLLKDILADKAFKISIKATEKKEIIAEIAEFFAEVYGMDPLYVKNGLWARESKGSTGLGKGLAIPHGRVPSIGSMKLAIFYSKEGKDFDSYDRNLTHLFIAAIIDEDSHPQEQLEMLRIIVEMCERTDLMTAIHEADSSSSLKEIVVRRLTEIQNG